MLNAGALAMTIRGVKILEFRTVLGAARRTPAPLPSSRRTTKSQATGAFLSHIRKNKLFQILRRYWSERSLKNLVKPPNEIKFAL
jgi:hypothetical protein